MKNVLTVLALALCLFASSCSQQINPATRYAKTHSAKKFDGWDKQAKRYQKLNK